jgi:hypothetical protein
MELALNLVWVMLAALCAGLWMRHARRKGVSPQVQVVALLMLLVILLPVISVTDDLQSLQNPAELDCCARRYHAASCLRSFSTVVAALPPQAMAGLFIGFLRIAVPSYSQLSNVKIPAMASVQNRPPPPVA